MGIGVTRKKYLEGIVEEMIESGDDAWEIIETVKTVIIETQNALNVKNFK